MKNKSQVMNEVDQLKKDGMLVSLESIAVSILGLLLFIGAPSVFPTIINPYLPSSLKILQVVIIVPLVFWLYAIVGNMIRLRKILKLQKSLKGKK